MKTATEEVESDQIRNDAGLMLLTAALHTVNRTGWWMQPPGNSARGQFSYAFKSGKVTH